MSSSTTYACTRCGKNRIAAKTWVEEVPTAGGSSKLTHTLMICPDPTCQAHVDADNAAQAKKREAYTQALEQRGIERAQRAARNRTVSSDT